MDARKRKRLEATGWKVGSVKDFLGLSEEEAALVELKLSLADALRQSRTKRGLSQTDLAKRMKSSQSRVAKIEAGDPSVSLDLMVRALVASGATAKERQEGIRVPLPSGRLSGHHTIIGSHNDGKDGPAMDHVPYNGCR